VYMICGESVRVYAREKESFVESLSAVSAFHIVDLENELVVESAARSA
jgi:hypothetical protein